MNPAPPDRSQPPRLLVVDDEPDLLTLYELTLVREGYHVECAATVEEAWALLLGQPLSSGSAGAEQATEAPLGAPFQLLITDMRLPDGTGMDLLRRIEEAGRQEKAIVITAYGSPENAVEALKAGAYDYLTKPVDLRQFRAVVASALGRAAGPTPRSGATGSRAPQAPGSNLIGGASAAAPATVARAALQRMVGTSEAMQQVRGMVEKVARSMAPVLVTGESGTGKELVARGIHDVSPRSLQPFVAVNCGAIPEALLEAEFFGYRKGAFTGANEDREGFFQAAQGGTLFLDEIGDLPLLMQTKLLRVIQERAVRPIGAVAETPINVRLVSATHKDLGAEALAGRFRQDLYYRLNVIRIAVPPLRERMADLPAICQAVLERIARDAGVLPRPMLAAEALSHLLRYPFPGNVRELENLLHRALALASGPVIELMDLGLPATAVDETDGNDSEASAAAQDLGASSRAATAIASGQLPMQSPLHPPTHPPTHSGTHLGTPSTFTSQTLIPTPPQGLPQAAMGAVAPQALPRDLALYLDAVERQILEVALERHRYNRTAAGASLGLSLRQMRYRMARLGVGAAESAADRGETA